AGRGRCRGRRVAARRGRGRRVGRVVVHRRAVVTDAGHVIVAALGDRVLDRLRRHRLLGDLPALVEQLPDDVAQVLRAVDGEVHAVGDAHLLDLTGRVGERSRVTAVGPREQL